MTDAPLAGRIAVVTGGAAGIGGATSRRLAAAGATVVVNDIDGDLLATTVAEIGAAGHRVEPVAGDIRLAATVGELAHVALGVAGGRIDVLVNNVGDYRPNGRFLKTAEPEWDALYAVNLEHVFRCTRAFAPAMVEAGSGSIVNVSTVEAFRGIPANAVYSAFNAGDQRVHPQPGRRARARRRPRQRHRPRPGRHAADPRRRHARRPRP